jgi:hypothetical protein
MTLVGVISHMTRVRHRHSIPRVSILARPHIDMAFLRETQVAVELVFLVQAILEMPASNLQVNFSISSCQLRMLTLVEKVAASLDQEIPTPIPTCWEHFWHHKHWWWFVR